MSELQGRRRPDLGFSELHDDVQPGDYWKIINEDGTPMAPPEPKPSNITGTVWMVAAPIGDGYGLGHLMAHTVREEDDGTISVRHGDGSSNSILVQRGAGGRNGQFHGYIEHGVWRSA